MTGPVRVGVIGAGWIADTHRRNIEEIGGAVVAAVADPDAERARLLAEPSGAETFAGWDDLLSGADVDAVLVCTPPALHREPALSAFRRGVAVYLEKPIARSSDDAAAIVESAGAAGAVCAVGYQYRALGFLPELRRLVVDARPGFLVSRGIGPAAGRGWFVDQAAGGGQVLERASHHIDLQRALAGEVGWVQAAGARVPLAGSDRPADSDIDDVVSLTLGFRSGALGSVLIAWTDRTLGAGAYDLELVAADARLRVELDPAFAATGVTRRGQVSLRTDEPPIRAGLRRFLEAVRAEDPGAVACTPADAAGTLAVAEACERAAASGSTVEVAA